MVLPKSKPKGSDTSCCPLSSKPRLRLASDAQTASIKGNFPKGIAQPALRALFAAGFTAIEQLTTISEHELLGLHGMGPNAVRKIRDGLHEKGMDLRK
jgi:hypothetical protein